MGKAFHIRNILFLLAAITAAVIVLPWVLAVAKEYSDFVVGLTKVTAILTYIYAYDAIVLKEMNLIIELRKQNTAVGLYYLGLLLMMGRVMSSAF